VASGLCDVGGHVGGSSEEGCVQNMPVPRNLSPTMAGPCTAPTFIFLDQGVSCAALLWRAIGLASAGHV